MSALLDPYGPGRGFLSARNLLLGSSLLFSSLLFLGQATPARAALTAFLVTSLLCAWVMSRGSLEAITVDRLHRARVFEDDPVPVTLRIRQEAGLAQSMVLVEDRFLASLSVRQRHLLPMMSPQWEAHLHYRKDAERHRGLYLLGPVRLWAADPLGVFFRRCDVDCITSLTVYPHAVPLQGYTFPGPEPPSAPTLDNDDRLGQGEEIISVRPYRKGDPANRIHWKTSLRRRELHTMELDTHVQSEIALFLDLSRRAQFGTGAESTTETAIRCATSILTEAGNRRHRVSLTWTGESIRSFPPGAGSAHLHLLLDRLATVAPRGNLLFWEEVAPAAALLSRGSRAVFVAPAASTPPADACALIQRLALSNVAVDVVLLDESNLTRIWKEQSPTPAGAQEAFRRLKVQLERAGARVLPLGKGQSTGDLLPRAGEDLDIGK